jgi:hypothetical protein
VPVPLLVLLVDRSRDHGRIQQLWDSGQLREGEKVSRTRVYSLFDMQLFSGRAVKCTQQLWGAGQLREGEKVSRTRVCSILSMQCFSGQCCAVHSAAGGCVAESWWNHRGAADSHV